MILFQDCSERAVKPTHSTEYFAAKQCSDTFSSSFFVFFNRWGYVCDNSFDKRDAEVVCSNIGHVYKSFKTSINVAENSAGELA